MDEKRPILSFCIPTFNRADIVFQNVKHILEHDGDEIEVVVSDNHSDDNTLELLGTIKDKRLKVFTNPENIRAFNWPLAISRASGKWAALMSDEDPVILENIPYFLELLPACDDKRIGAVIYTLNPLFDRYDYCCKDAIESFAYAMLCGGHITAHILNMKCFELLENSKYVYTDASTPRTEPQFEVLLNTIQSPLANKLLLTEKGLCAFGEIAPNKKNDAALKYTVETFGGESPEYRMIGFEALVRRTAKHKDDRRFVPLLFIPLRRYATLTVGPMSKLLTVKENHEDRPFLWQAMRNYYGTETNTIINYCSKHIVKLIGIINKNTGQDFSICADLVEKAFQNEFDYEIPDSAPLFRILTGDMLSFIIPNMYMKHGDKIFQRLGMTVNVLEYEETGEMFNALKQGDYDFVINYKKLKTHRALYLRGQAYLFKRDFDSAFTCFRSFLDIVENPKVLADIITGTMSIVCSYYYLGHLSQQRGDINEAVKYFARCHELNDLLMQGEKLNAKFLGLERFT